MEQYLFGAAVCLVLGTGCAATVAVAPSAGGAPVASLMAQARVDLACPTEDLQVTPVDAKVRKVSGCGHQVTYVDVCDVSPNGTSNCRWVLEVPAKEPRRSPI